LPEVAPLVAGWETLTTLAVKAVAIGGQRNIDGNNEGPSKRFFLLYPDMVSRTPVRYLLYF